MKRLAPALTLARALALAGVLHVTPASACSVLPQWRPPTPQQAFDAAQVVVHARVRARSGLDEVMVNVEVLRVLKGTFSGTTITTGSGSMCGMPVVDGADYVFFFPKGHGYSASFVYQPDLKAEQILSQIPEAALRNAQAAVVPTPTRASGQYFQLGFRGPATATTNDPDPFVEVQIDVGTQASCESRLAVIEKRKATADVLGSGTWCSANSASAQLKYAGVFKNRTTGRSVQVEASDLLLCTTAAEALTGAHAPNNNVEIVSACQAR